MIPSPEPEPAERASLSPLSPLSVSSSSLPAAPGSGNPDNFAAGKALEEKLTGRRAISLRNLPGFSHRLVHNDWFEGFIIFCVIVNAAIIGLDAQLRDTHPFHGPARVLDLLFLMIFTAELALKLAAFRLAGFFRNGWNVFDLIVIAASWSQIVPALSALRVLRVLRALRLLHVVPQMRRIIESLSGAIPGIGATVAVLFVVFFIGAVMATTLYGHLWPERFGTLALSALTLFQLTLFDNWGDIVFTMMNDKGAPGAWIFFIIFTFLSAFAVMNLFIGVIVDAVQQSQTKIISEKAGDKAMPGPEPHGVEAETTGGQREQHIAGELAALRQELGALREALARQG